MLLEELGVVASAGVLVQTLEHICSCFQVAASPFELLFHTVLLDNLMMRFLLKMVPEFFLATCVQSIGQTMPHDKGFSPFLEVGTTVKALRQHLDVPTCTTLHFFGAAPTVGVAACRHHHSFRPFSHRRRYCLLFW